MESIIAGIVNGILSYVTGVWTKLLAKEPPSQGDRRRALAMIATVAALCTVVVGYLHSSTIAGRDQAYTNGQPDFYAVIWRTGILSAEGIGFGFDHPPINFNAIDKYTRVGLFTWEKFDGKNRTIVSVISGRKMDYAASASSGVTQLRPMD